MKKILALTMAAGILAGATAQAQVNIYVTGSTAFRANAYRSIRALYGGNLSNQNPADGGGNASGSNVVTWSGTMPTLFGGQSVTVRASYSGSAAGVQTVAQNLIIPFYSTSTPGDGTTVSSQADLAFSDVFQATTAFLSPILTDTNVGVLPFVYVRSLTTPATVTNITLQQLQAFLSGGVMPLSYFTGNSSDDSSLIYKVGRDTGSGTRLTEERDALFIGTPLLWAPDGSCNWNVIPGFSSNSGVTAVLNGSCGPALGYLSLSDAKTVNAGNNVVRFNGYLPYAGSINTPDFTPVRKGLSSSWGYEHLMRRSSSSANVVTFWKSLANEINNDIGPNSSTLIQISSMQVSRPTDGGPISP